MKNLVEIRTNQNCGGCRLSGFFCTTPSGADYYTCPMCGDDDYLNSGHHRDHITPQADALWDAIVLGDYDDCGDLRVITPFCVRCRVVFNVGCTHACNGCTSDDYNGHLVGEWRDKTTGAVYVGMPQFESTEDWFHCVLGAKIEVLKWICPNNGRHCTRGSYPKGSHPQYYSQCSLCVAEA